MKSRRFVMNEVFPEPMFRGIRRREDGVFGETDGVYPEKP